MIKEYSININDNIDIKYGSINHKLPLVIYINCKAWVCPQNDGEYELITKQTFAKFKANLKKIVQSSPFFENKFMCDFDLNASTMKVNKKNYLEFEFYVKQKDKMLSLHQIKPTIEKSFKTIIDAFVEDLQNNTLFLTKSKF